MIVISHKEITLLILQLNELIASPQSIPTATLLYSALNRRKLINKKYLYSL